MGIRIKMMVRYFPTK